MNLISMSAAAKYPFAPSQPYMSKLSKRDDRPGFFVRDFFGLKIDADSTEWVEYLKKRQAAAEKTANSKNQSVEHVDIDSRCKTLAELQREKLRRDVQSLDLKNAMGREKLERDSRDLIDFDLAKFTFDTYMDSAEKAASEETEAIRPKLRELLQEAIKTGYAEATATAITAAITRKNEGVIKQAKTETRQAIEEKRDAEEDLDG